MASGSQRRLHVWEMRVSSTKSNAGAGITARRSNKQILNPNDPKDVDNIISYFENAQDAVLRPWAQQAQIIAGIKAQAERLRAEVLEAIEADPEYMRSDAYRSRYEERVTEQWYIRDMAANATLAEICVRDGRPWEAVSWAMRIAEALTELRLKFAWETPALWGKTQLDARKSGAEMVRKHSAEDRKARVEALVDSGMSKRAAFEAVGAEMRIHSKTVERDYYSRPRPME